MCAVDLSKWKKNSGAPNSRTSHHECNHQSQIIRQYKIVESDHDLWRTCVSVASTRTGNQCANVHSPNGYFKHISQYIEWSCRIYSHRAAYIERMSRKSNKMKETNHRHLYNHRFITMIIKLRESKKDTQRERRKKNRHQKCH